MSDNITELRSGRRYRNGHILELQGCEWRCIHCFHWFDAASDADAFWCGDDCTQAHATAAAGEPHLRVADALDAGATS